MSRQQVRVAFGLAICMVPEIDVLRGRYSTLITTLCQYIVMQFGVVPKA